MTKNEYETIKEFADDHYKRFGAYPMEVETEKQIYTFEQYWLVLEMQEETTQ